MSRYIDAEWLEDNAKEYSLGYYEADEWATPLSILDSAPSIEIVKCHECNKLNDCRNDSWQTGVIERGYIGWCNRTSRLGDVDYVKFNDFCSYGERSEP